LMSPVALAAGGPHTCALRPPGYIWCWGRNDAGQLGNGTTNDSSAPVLVSGITTASSVDAGLWHTCAVLATGTVSCWGGNNSGQLGDGTKTSQLTPVDVSGLSASVLAVALGGEHTCALLATGAVWCWGNNEMGQLGNGTSTTRLVPVQVSGL